MHRTACILTVWAAVPAASSAAEVEDGALGLEFHGLKVTSDAGLLLYRELDEVLGLTAIPHGLLDDGRTERNTRGTLVGLLRQSVFSRLAGYEATNDAERLALPWSVEHGSVEHGSLTRLRESLILPSLSRERACRSR